MGWSAFCFLAVPWVGLHSVPRDAMGLAAFCSSQCHGLVCILFLEVPCVGLYSVPHGSSWCHGQVCILFLAVP